MPQAFPRLRELTRAAGVFSVSAGRRLVGRRQLAITAASMAAERKRFVLNLDTINPNLKGVQYAVRGPVLDRAMEIDRDLARVRSYLTVTRRPSTAHARVCIYVPIATTRVTVFV